MPLASRVKRGEGYGNPEAGPAGAPHDHLKATRIRIVLAGPGRLPQGMFAPPFVLHRAIPNQIEAPLRWGGRGRRVVVAILAPTAAASHWPDRIIRLVVPSLRVGGRSDISPLSVPVPHGSRPSATNSKPDNGARGRNESAS